MNVTVIIIIILIIAYLYFRFKKEEVSEKKQKKSKKEKNVMKKAERLYNAVHKRMSKGMTYDEFATLAEDLADMKIYIGLRQLYNSFKSKGIPPENVSLNQYVSILQN
ncbi:MAG: hypothetical protein QW303_01690 [Nitrososphaerota archaeon]